jgi:hypothetical protein
MLTFPTLLQFQGSQKRLSSLVITHIIKIYLVEGCVGNIEDALGGLFLANLAALRLQQASVSQSLILLLNRDLLKAVSMME